MRRDDPLRARDIIDAIDKINGWTRKGASNWDTELFRSGVLRELAVIGEAANHLSEDLKAKHPEVGWRSIVGFRNKVVHEYWDTAWAIAERAMNEQLPNLRMVVAPIAVALEGAGADGGVDQLFEAATKVALAQKRAGMRAAAPGADVCSGWMPISRTRCVLPRGHKGHHRSC